MFKSLITNVYFQNMGSQWLTLVCVCALAASPTLSAAFPTQETLVVANTEIPVSKDLRILIIPEFSGYIYLHMSTYFRSKVTYVR